MVSFNYKVINTNAYISAGKNLYSEKLHIILNIKIRLVILNPKEIPERV